MGALRAPCRDAHGWTTEIPGHGHAVAEPPLSPIRRLRGRAAGRPGLTGDSASPRQGRAGARPLGEEKGGVGSPGHGRTPPPQPRDARGRAGLAARAVLRPRLRPRDHAVHAAHVGPSDAGRGWAQGCSCSALLWWSWVGYAWLTSVVDPEDDAVRLVIFAAMAGLLIVALAVPEAFGDLGLAFALAYGVVRFGQIGAVPAREPRRRPRCATRCSALAAAPRSASALLVGGSFLDGGAQAAVWAVALVLDMGGPYFFGSEGWKLVPAPLRRAPRADRDHRARRVDRRDRRRGGAASSASARARPRSSGSRWPPRCGGSTSTWSPSSRRGGSSARPGRVQNEMARDSYSYLHFPMVAGHRARRARDEEDARRCRRPAEDGPGLRAARRLAAYLLAHVSFRYRHVHTINTRRAGLAVILLAFLPVATEIPALATVTLVATLAWLLIVVETRSYGEGRARVRHEDFAHEASS